MIAVTGAGGHLGHLVVKELLRTVPAGDIAALARTMDKAQDLARAGVEVRHLDYDRPETHGPALEGVDRLLLISGSEVGRRVPQHRAVIESARAAGVTLLAYTSILRADSTPLALGLEHRATEAALRASGVPFVLLRNGWYTENYLGAIPTALERGELLGCAGDGRIASAARADYAAAAAAVLTREGQAGRIYELAGDEAYTLSELAAEVERRSGRPLRYRDLGRAGYRAALLAAGLPEGLAEMLADSDDGAARGGLFDDGRQLSALIGRPTTSLGAMIQAAL